MIKQDRQGVRTAQDLERKYRFGLKAQSGVVKDSEQVGKVVQELSEYKTIVNKKFNDLETAASSHALASDLSALADCVAMEATKTETLQKDMDAVEALIAANQAAINATYTAIDLKASKEELKEVSDRVTVIEAWKDDIEEVESEDISGWFT